MNKRSHSLLTTCALVLLIAAARMTPAADQTADRVTALKGGVSYRTQQGTDWKQLSEEIPLPPGTEYRLAEKAQMRASYSDVLTWILAGPAKLRSFGLNRQGKPGASDIELNTGVLALTFHPRNSKSAITIETQAGIVDATGDAVFTVDATSQNSVEISIGLGNVCFRTTQKADRKCSDSGTLIWTAENGKFTLLPGVTPQKTKVWIDNKWVTPLVKPTLRIDSPQENSYFSKSSISVTGIASAGSAVSINNKSCDVKSSGVFHCSIILFEGANKIIVKAKSPAGGITSVTRTAFLDSTPPLLTVTQPISSFDPSTVGTCDSRRCYIQIFGLTEPGVALYVNNINMSRYIEDDGSFLIQEFPIEHRTATLNIEVQDNLRQRTYEILHVIPPMDSDNDNTPDAYDPCPLDPSCN